VKVVIDDRLPYVNRRNLGGGYYYPARLMGSKKSANGAYWSALFEKAAGKFWCTYGHVEGGAPAVAFSMLTGMPTRHIYLPQTSVDKHFKDLEEAVAKKWMMVVGNNLAVYGLPGNHAYSLMNTATLSDGTKLVKLRNPWGTEQYTGPYSDSQLTAAQIQELDHVIGDDGVFWIDMNTFFLVMNWSNIAMYENWNTSKLDATWNRSNSNLNNWTYVNSQTQDVVIGIETFGQNQFANTTCSPLTK